MSGSEEAPSIAANALRTEDPILKLRDVCFAYPDGTQVLDQVSLSIERGEILAIIGPSGSGKSTLLSLLAGLMQPTSGTVEHRFGTRDDHPLSMVFQKDTLLPWLTVAENVGLFARFKRHGLRRTLRRLGSRELSRSRVELDGQVSELLDLVGLSSNRHAYPYQLSGGMRRRLAFLTAVAVKPQVLLLDEPFSSVDEPTRIGIHQDVLRVARLMEMTMVLVTHDLAEAISLSDRIIVFTNRPARIAREQSVPFGGSREVFKLRETQPYLELYASLWHELTAQIVSGEGEGSTRGRHGS